MEEKLTCKHKKYKKIKKLSFCCPAKYESKSLEAQMHFLQTILEAIPSPVFYKDKEGVYKGCNKEFERYTGLTKAQMMNKGVYELYPIELAHKYYSMDKDLLQKKTSQVYESEVLYADGSKHNVIFHKATYLDVDGNIAGLVGVISDITERVQAENALKESSRKIFKVFEQIVDAMAMITETRDLYTAGHQKKVAEIAVAIAQEMGLTEDSVEAVKVAGLLHDIGKIVVPAEILSKPSALTVNEFAIVKEHCEVGYNILKRIDFPWPVAEIVYQHHERLDGSGYPRGLQGNDILLEAQIITVADVAEAMMSHRPYRPSLGLAQAIREININKGVFYNADVVKACGKVLSTKVFFAEKAK